ILDELHRFDKNVLRKVSEPVNDVLHKSDKNVLRPAAEPPVKEVLHEFDKNVLRKVVTALGLRRIRKTYQEFKVRKTYKEFKQEVVHSKVTFTADSYRVEKIVPCPDGQHDIMDAEQPVEIYFEDGVKIIQDRYCRKCGQHFFSEGERKDEL
ncbi:unnamed protein product, partial [Porites lobata]